MTCSKTPMSLAFGLLAVSCWLAPAAIAQSITITPELKQIIEAASKEGQIALMVSQSGFNGELGARAAEAGINKMFGSNLKVRWTPGPAYAAMGTKLVVEYQAKQPAASDVYLGTAVQMSSLLRSGVFAEVDWAKLYAGRINREMVEVGNRALRNYTSLPGVLYNLKVEADVKKTTSLQDFLKPEWKGKFVTTPYLAGFDVLIADSVWGEAKTREYVSAMSGQIGGLLACGAPDRIASGEMPVLVLDCNGGSPNEEKYRSVLGIHILDDAAQERYGYLAIPKNARNPNAAILFTLYWSSPEGQQTLFRLLGRDLTDFPESQTRKTMQVSIKKGITFQTVTIDWWNAQADVAKKHRSLVNVISKK